MRPLGTNKHILNKSDKVRLRDEEHYENPCPMGKDYDRDVFFRLSPDIRIDYEKLKDATDRDKYGLWHTIYFKNSVAILDMHTSLWRIGEGAGF